MLRSIAYQIFEKDERLFALIRERFRKLKLEESLWNYEDLKSILRSLRNTPFSIKIYIAVDGMDESDNARRDDVLKFLFMLAARESESRCIFKILIASRPENDIRPWMKHAQHISLENMNQDDIRIFVEEEIRKLQSSLDYEIAPSEVRIRERIFKDAKIYILKISCGVFLWVYLVLKELRNLIQFGGYSEEDIGNCVRALPTELGGSKGFYALMVEKLVGAHTIIPQSQRARGRYIFAWLTLSTQPLCISELGDALAVFQSLSKDLNPKTFDLERTRPFDFERGLYSLCGDLVEVRNTCRSQKRL